MLRNYTFADIINISFVLFVYGMALMSIFITTYILMSFIHTSIFETNHMTRVSDIYDIDDIDNEYENSTILEISIYDDVSNDEVYNNGFTNEVFTND